MERIELGDQLRRRAPAYVLGALCLGAFQLSMNRIDWLAKGAVDAVFGAGRTGASRAALAMLALAAFAFVARVASRWFIFNAGRDAEYELRAALLDRLHRLGAAFYRRMSAGEIMSRATNDLLQVRLLLGFGILNVVNVLFAFASALQVMLTVSAKLTLAALTNLPFLILYTRTVGKSLYTRTKANQEALGKMSEVLQANLAGVRVVRSFALGEVERRRFDAANAQYLEASLGFARLRGSMGPAMGAAGAVSLVVFFAYGGSLLLAGELSRGDFFAFWLALGRMTWPMIALGFSLAIVQRGRAGFVRLKAIFDAEPEIVDGPLPAPSTVRGDVAVTGLSFAYGARKVLDDVTFDVRRGRSLAILGRTGSGKSTLAMLLARLLPTPRGTVAIDGVDVCDLPLAAVRGVVGYAQQDAFLFSTTVARNVAFAFDDAPGAAARVEEAATEAQVWGEVQTLSEREETVVGERGVQLSGGQKQRVALARALAWGPRILVLVTHRVAAAARCDDILVLDRGRVAERGTHAELLALGGIYAAFAEEQEMARELEEIDVA